MNRLLSVARKPVVTIDPSATVEEASKLMLAESVGVLVVMREDEALGIISERDIVRRVVAQRGDAARAKVEDAMSAPVRTVDEDTTTHEALALMHEGRFRHLPVVDCQGRVVAMLSVRDLLRLRIGELAIEKSELVAYISTDGPGG